MLYRIVVICLTLLFLSGCATKTPIPVLNLAETSTVGIINMVDPQITHTHIGTTVFNNFTKQYPIPWSLPNQIENELARLLKEKTQFKVVFIKPPEALLQDENGLLERTWGGDLLLKQTAAPLVQKIMQENKVDFLLILANHMMSDHITGSNQFLKHYGLLTRTFLVIRASYGYACINGGGYYGNPPKYVGGNMLNADYSPEDFKFPPDLKNIETETFEPIFTLISEDVPEFAMGLLENTGLISHEKNKSSKSSLKSTE